MTVLYESFVPENEEGEQVCKAMTKTLDNQNDLTTQLRNIYQYQFHKGAHMHVYCNV